MAELRFGQGKYMALVAYVEGSEPVHVRLHRTDAPKQSNASLHSYSGAGFLLEADLEIAIGSKLVLCFDNRTSHEARATWAGPGLFGCLFVKPVDPTIWPRDSKSRKRGGRARPFPERRAGDEHLGARIKRLRLQRGLRQEAVAAALGVSTASVSHWESGRALPKSARLIELARLFGVPDKELETPAHEPATSREAVERLRLQIAGLLGVSPEHLRFMVEFGV